MVGSSPTVRHARQIVGKRRAKSSIIDASRNTWSVPVSRMRSWIARETTSRGARSASGCTPAMNATPSSSRSTAPSPRKRLREQRPRHRRVVQRSGMELHELEVGARDARLERERDAVAGRERRVRRDCEALPDAARREHRVDRADELDLAVGAEREHAAGSDRRSTSSSSANQPSRTSMSAVLDGRDERALDLGAGRVAAGVHDAGERVAAFACEQQVVRRRRRISVSKRAPSAASSRTAAGPSVTSTRTASTSQSPAPATSVSARCRSGESGSASAAATPPCA